MSSQTPDKLFDGFVSQSKQSWLNKIEADLRLENHTDLNWSLGSQLSVSPFAHLSDLEENYAPINRNNGWRLGCPIYVSEPTRANHEALELLSQGCDALHFVMEDEITVEAFRALFSQINLSWIHLQFVSDIKNLIALQKNFRQFLVEQQIEALTIRVAWGYTEPTTPQYINALISDIRGPSNSSTLLIESPFHSFDEHLSGLSALLHDANRMLKLTHVQSTSASKVPAIQFALLMQENYYGNIACMRAFRIGWLKVLRAWEIEQKTDTLLQAFIKTSPFPNDQNLEKISFTTQALAAVVGGADQILFIPSEKNRHNFNEKRLQLNIQHLLKLESHLDWVNDPGAGSYFIEKLTQDVAERIWVGFQALEKNS